ncbi:MAG: XdhC family protein [Pseudomonadota bacterium]
MLALSPDLDPAQEHPEDVFASALQMADRGQRVALAIVTGTEGGAVRAPGAMMAVSEAGDAAGYVSGGCIDADLIGQAQRALHTGRIETLRYGRGSPFVDLRLPCGGAIDVLIWPMPDQAILREAKTRLQSRQPVQLVLGLDGHVDLEAARHRKTGWAGERLVLQYQPKLKLRFAGKGAEIVALSRVAAACNLPITVQSPDVLRDLEQLDHPSLKRVALQTPLDVPANDDDRWTAFVLMFHDTDWETALLADALAGPAFFVGAVGSRATQAKRRAQLIEAGVPEADVDRIRGPIGLVPSLRDASLLAVSALAQIIEAHKDLETA